MKQIEEIKVGDVIVMHEMDEVIEILTCQVDKGIVQYWSDRYPDEIGTKNCRIASSWIIFRHGEIIGNVAN